MKVDDFFAGMYEADVKGGCHRVAPEKLLRAMHLQVFYSIRSERQRMEQVRYNLLYCGRINGHRANALSQ